MMLVWGVLPVWADISVATLHNARKNSFLLGCALSRFFGVYTYVINLYLFPINLLSVQVAGTRAAQRWCKAARTNNKKLGHLAKKSLLHENRDKQIAQPLQAA